MEYRIGRDDTTSHKDFKKKMCIVRTPNRSANTNSEERGRLELACGIFAGAALYINLVEHPARVSCGVTLAITECKPSYRRGAIMQGSLALAGSILGLISWWNGKQARAWLYP
jgi:hypothetical protein